jgi:hypothetical protein
MQTNPIEEWQRLAGLYREMGDIELRELAAGIDDLTEVAQQVLRDELKKRGMPETPPPIENRAASNVSNDNDWDSVEDPSELADSEEVGGGHEYTWKTALCECDTSKEAWQLVLALRQAGIDSWVEKPQSAAAYPRVTVAADQLDQAREVASRSIPQEIIDDLSEEAPVYQLPSCPQCGAADPTLEGAEPSNSWHCESCGNDWTDPIEDIRPDSNVSP